MSNKNVSATAEASVSAYVKLIRSAEVLHAEVSRGLNAAGITATQFSTLKALRLAGPLAQRDIASHLCKTGGNITVVVDNLEKRGLVERTRDEADRRIVYVQLTPEGQQIYDRLCGPHLERIVSVMALLSPCECHELCALLDKLTPPARVSRKNPCRVNLMGEE